MANIKPFKFATGTIIRSNNKEIKILECMRIKNNGKQNYSQKAYKYKCSKCNYIGFINEKDIIKGENCPVCSGHKVVKGINDLMTTDFWLAKYVKDVHVLEKYSRGSNKKIDLICPLCGYIDKNKVINRVIKAEKYTCPKCSDGKSYPEKFVLNVLEQLNLVFETEYSPKWIKPKRYDFYIEDLNMIIETHGEQHYNGHFESVGGRTLEEEQANDKYKREIALANGIKHYIELDCRESNMDWIKNSILSSKLAKIFDLSRIDWNKCAEFANKNIIKEACNYWNEGIKSTTKISEIIGVSRQTIRKYLCIGKELKWCDYNVEISNYYKNKKVSEETKSRCSKKIICLNNNKIFDSASECSKQSEEIFGVKLTTSSIGRVCRNERKQYKGLIFKYL
ncbi:hypothetical protein GNF86_01435 [Clostridium perfringens]